MDQDGGGFVPTPRISYTHLPPVFLGNSSPTFVVLFAVVSPFSPSCPQDSRSAPKKVTERARNVDMIQMAGKNHIA